MGTQGNGDWSKASRRFLFVGSLVALFITRLEGADTIVQTGQMAQPLLNHTATLLANGKVLVCGGGNSPSATATLYDIAAANWTTINPMTTNRSDHTATMLRDGRVLVAGGNGPNGTYRSAEIYNPATGAWAATGNMGTNRYLHTATLLPNGKVIVAGGLGAEGPHGSTPDAHLTAELYDPSTGLWTPAGPMVSNRAAHCATVLPDGNVLVAGGQKTTLGTTTIRVSELYNPATGTWSLTGPLNTARYRYTLTVLPNGLVLAAGGSSAGSTISSAEIYAPATGFWYVTNSMASQRALHTATLLPNGKVLVLGGGPSNSELYDTLTGNWTSSVSPGSLSGHSATLLPGGRVLVADGNSLTCFLFDFDLGSWSSAGSMSAARSAHTTSLLTNGLVLVAGGSNPDGPISSSELFDPATAAWTNAGSLGTPRSIHTATVLSDGKVLVAGGMDSTNTFLATAELFSPQTATWALTGPLRSARAGHIATLLANGKVLVAGGYDATRILSSAEIYDPVSETWRDTGPMNGERDYFTANLLASGRVLVAGGSFSLAVPRAELYDPATEAWATTGPTVALRNYFCATLLPRGWVLVSGGFLTSYPNVLNTSELYNPDSGTWQSVNQNMQTARYFHASTLLANGKVLVTGGSTNGSATASAELFDPASGSLAYIWRSAGSMSTPRLGHSATLLRDGRVLVTGGHSGGFTPTNADIYDPGPGFSPNWRPQIADASSTVTFGGSLSVTGSQFRGMSQASSGGRLTSDTDYPLLQLRSLNSARTAFLSVSNWSTNFFSSLSITGFPAGPALATIFVNGIPSTSAMVQVIAPMPTVPFLTDLKSLSNGSFRFGFTNTPGTIFGVLATTNVALPMSNWTVAGSASEIAPGQFQFTDVQAASPGHREYRVRLP